MATPVAGGATFVQMWSEARKDSFLVVEGGSHARTANSTGYNDFDIIMFAPVLPRSPPPTLPPPCSA